MARRGLAEKVIQGHKRGTLIGFIGSASTRLFPAAFTVLNYFCTGKGPAAIGCIPGVSGAASGALLLGRQEGKNIPPATSLQNKSTLGTLRAKRDFLGGGLGSLAYFPSISYVRRKILTASGAYAAIIELSATGQIGKGRGLQEQEQNY